VRQQFLGSPWTSSRLISCRLSCPPPGFRLQFKADGKPYAFSLKDTLDSWHYGIFSDQDQWIYHGTPQ
jgi:hypothetical protein